MQQELKEFFKKNKPKGKKSKLEKYRAEIVDLRYAGYSYEQIKDYLVKYKKVKINKTTICKYYKKLEKKAEQVPAQKLEIKQIENIQKKSNQITNKTKQLKTKKALHKPPKPITDADFLKLCSGDQVTYCYYLFLADYTEEAERLLNLEGVGSVERMQFGRRKRKLYERYYMKDSKYEPDD